MADNTNPTTANQTAGPTAAAPQANKGGNAAPSTPLEREAAVAAASFDAFEQKRTQEGNKVQRTSTLITNPPPPVADPSLPPVEPKVDESQLPQSTLDEMEAGRRALNRNRPVAAAIEQSARERGEPVPPVAAAPKA